MAADGHGDWTRRSVFQLTGAAFALPAFQPSQLEIRRMAFSPKFVDLVRNVATVAGTGPVTLGAAVNGYSSLARAVAAGEQFYYCIQGIDKPAEREIGRGTMQSDGRVARQPVAGALTNFSGGTKTIALVAAAEWFATLDQLAAGAAAGIANRAELAARPTGAAAPALLQEAERQGLFTFDGSDLSTKVAADTAQGILVAPTTAPTGASGAWVRKFNGPVDPRWFGLSTANSGAQNGAALQALFATLRARSNSVFTSSQAVEPILFPSGTFNFDSTIELTDGTWIIEGAGAMDATGTVLKFPAGVTGIRVQRYNTSGASGAAGATHRGSDRSIIRNLVIDGAYSGTEAEAHGVHLRAAAFVENVIVSDFQGDGVHINAVATGDPEGNANNFRLVGVRSIRNRNGFYVNGADANAGILINCDATANRQWGFWDSSFLGNSYIGCHSAANGHANGANTSTVSHSGNRYFLIVGQEAGGSTNAPSGTTADNAWWAYLAPGGVSSDYPAWTSGTAYRAGGAFHTDSVSGSTVMVGCYREADQAPAQLTKPTLAIGGNLAGSIRGTGAGLFVDEAGGLTTNRAFRQESISSGGATTTTQLGEPAPVYGTVIYASESAVAPGGHRLKYSGNDLVFDYANAGTGRAFLITDPSTTLQLGTGVAQPHAMIVPHLAIGDLAESAGNARRIAVDTAAPTIGAHAQGEVVFNRTPVAGGPMGWMCVASGTPGTWKAMANLAP